jgi:hypothetical protein
VIVCVATPDCLDCIFLAAWIAIPDCHFQLFGLPTALVPVVERAVASVIAAAIATYVATVSVTPTFVAAVTAAVTFAQG